MTELPLYDEDQPFPWAFALLAYGLLMPFMTAAFPIVVFLAWGSGSHMP